MKCLFLFFFLTATVCAQTFRAEDNGADPTLHSNTAAIQATLEQASAGGTVTITTPGTYLLATQGTNPYQSGHKYCLDFKYDNVTFFLGSGVTLKLANGQQLDGAPVDMLVFRSRSGLTFAGASDGSSTITANAAGQTGWTLGYSQIAHGVIISGYGTANGNANSGITVKDLFLEDHFSNPINIDRQPSAARNSNIRIERIRASDCGEGIQVISADDVWIEDCLVESPGHVAVGDGIEVANCTRFHIVRNTVKNHRAASGFDIFGSSEGVIDEWISDDNNAGLSVHAFGAVPDPKNVIVQNGVVINLNDTGGAGGGTGVELAAPTLTNIKVKNVTISGNASSHGFQIAAGGAIKGAGPITVEDCIVDGGSNGILIAAAFTDLTIKGGNYSNQIHNGIAYIFQGNGLAAADVKNLHIEGVTATGNGMWGINISNQGYTVPQITGSITNCSLGGNLAGPIIAAAEGGGITVENITPNSKTAFGGGAGAIVFGVRYLCPTGASVTTFQYPSRNQVLTISACEEREIIDARQGGDNIYLTSGQNARLSVGQGITLRFDSLTNKWHEQIPTITPRPPNISTEENSDKALALNATTFVREPFSSFTDPNFGEDKRTRIMLFVDNLDLEDLSLITVQAEDSSLRTYPLPIEYAGPVTNFSLVTQINVRLPAELSNVGEVWVSVSVRGITGNRARLVLAPN